MAGNELKAVITMDAANATFTVEKFVGQTVGGMGQAATAAKSTESAFGGLGGAAVMLNQGLQLVQQAGHLASAAFDLLVGGAQRTGEQYLLLSQQTGLTVEEISAMSLAAATADVSQEALALSTKKLSVNMVDSASGGKESTATFKALGVETKNVDGTLRNVNDVFLDTIDALGQISNDAERTAASQAVFGRSSQELAALIADGSGKIREQAELAAKLGLVWSGPAAQAADELGDQTTILGAALKGISDEVNARSIPSMTALVSSTNDWIAANRTAISQNIDRIFALAAVAADALSAAVHGVAGATESLISTIPGLRGYLSTIKEAATDWLDLQVQAQRAAKATDDTGRAFIAASEALTKAKEKQADYNLAIRDAGQLYPDQIAKQKELDQAVLDAQGAYDAAEAALDKSVTKGEQAARGNEFLAATLGTLRDKATASDAAIAQFATATGLSVEEVKKLDAGAKPTAAQIEKIAAATGKTAAEIEKALPGQRSFADGMKKTGDEALKSAQSVAQLAGQSVQFAQSQLQQAAATGSLTATTDAYVVAVGKAGEAYQASQKAADEAAAAGKSATEVTAMRTQAEQQLATAVNQAAATQATAYAREEAAQSSLAHSLGQTKIAHDMEALAMADATEVAQAYSQTVVDIAAELARTTDEINKKRGVTLTAAEADKLLAEANERAGQQISAAGKAAVQASSQVSEFGRAVQSASDQAANAFGDLAARIITGGVSFKDAGKAAAQIFMRAFEDVLSSTLGSVFKAGFDAAGGVIDSLIGDFAGSLGSAMGVDVAKEGTKGLVKGISSAVLEAALANPVTASIAVATAGLGIAFAVGWEQFFDKPDMQSRISKAISKMLAKSMQDVRVTGPIDAALEALGFDLSAGLAAAIVNAPLSGAEIRAVYAESGATAGQSFSDGFYAFIGSENNKAANQIAASDLVNLYFPGLDEASEAAATEMAKAAGAAAAAAQGLVGDDALVFAEQFGAGLTNLAHQMNLTDEEFLAFLEDVAGPGAAGFAAAMDQMNAAGMQAFGPQWQAQLDSVADHMERVFGLTEDINSGNLFDVFIKSGQSAETFAAQLERMAESDPQLRALIDSLDPPLVDALHAVEDGGNAAAKAIGKLTGQANTSLAGAEARILAFGDALFTVAEDGSKQLSTLGEELNSELVSGISGIEDAIKEEVNSAAGLTSDTLGEAFAELKSLAALPAEALDDSTTAAIDHLKAVIQAATGWSAEQIDTMIATAADVPPPVQPVPPETTASLDDAADSTGQIADNSQAAADASEQLTTATQGTAEAVAATTQGFADMASQTLSALQSVIGVADDGKSVQALSFQLDTITQFLPAELVPAFQESFDSANGSVSSTFTKVGELQSALTTLAGNYDITVTTHYVTDGEPPDTGGGDTGHAAGHWTVPGPQGAPYRTTVHGGEEVLSVEQSRDYRRTMRDRALEGLAPADERGIPAASASEQRGAGDFAELAGLLRRIERSLSDAPVMRVDVASRDALVAASEAGVEKVLMRKGARGDMWVEGRYVRFRP